jgi:3-polyprenyl-4-hydroxybenzoate decarboxylase
METNYITINYLGKNEKVLQYLSESDNQFNQRLKYIKKLENNKIVWKEANTLSKIWYNIKFKNCKYAPELNYKVINYDK